MQAQYQTIETDIKQGLFTLRQNRPDKLNARNSQMYVEIMAAFRAASANDDVAALMLTSTSLHFLFFGFVWFFWTPTSLF